MPDQEVIFNILNLLETMEEGLNYIVEKLDELKIEVTMSVLADMILAFSSIESTIAPMLGQLKENEIEKNTEELRKRLDIMVKEYEKKNGQQFYQIIQLSLEPVFRGWKEEIEVILRPYVVS